MVSLRDLAEGLGVTAKTGPNMAGKKCESVVLPAEMMSGMPSSSQSRKVSS